jgi:hypothetical protein
MAKITATETKLRRIINKGSEPNFAGLNHLATGFDAMYGDALNWIHHMVEPNTLRGEVERFLRDANRADEINRLDGVSQPILHTVGKIAYCINRGAELSERSYSYINRALNNPQITVTAPAATETMFDDMPNNASARVIEDYKNCYSRLDNLRARVTAGKVDVKDVQDEVNKVMDAHGGRPGVRRRVVEHFKDSLREAQEDKAIREWVKPLRAILKSLDKDATVAKAPKKVQAEGKPTEKVTTPKKKAAAKAANNKGKKTAAKKPAKSAKQKPAKQEGKPSFASQVRELIMEARTRDTSQSDVIELAVTKLGMTRSSARNCVIFNWERVGQ